MTKRDCAVDSAGNLLTCYVYATHSNVPDYLVRSGVTYRLVTDERGSVRLVVNASTGAVVSSLNYDVWGNVTSSTNATFQPFGFAGGLRDDATGLTHFGAREYTPELGRWTRKDPIGFNGGLADLYGYVGNDPVNWVDEDGLKPGDAYPTLNAAAVAAFNDYNNKSIAADREYAGYLYQKSCGGYSYTSPSIFGGKDWSWPGFTWGLDIEGRWHTHGGNDPGYNNEVFSPADIRNSENSGVPSYLFTLGGKIKVYYPKGSAN